MTILPPHLSELKTLGITELWKCNVLPSLSPSSSSTLTTALREKSSEVGLGLPGLRGPNMPLQYARHAARESLDFDGSAGYRYLDSTDGI